MQTTLDKLIWMDGMAALLSAFFVLILKSFLSKFLNIPSNVLLFMSIVSFMYAAYSLSLALLKYKPIFRVKILISGNLLWSLVCLLIIVYQIKTINIFGIIYLSAESLIVANLAWLEFRQLNYIK